jgi:hypothetical protein
MGQPGEQAEQSELDESTDETAGKTPTAGRKNPKKIPAPPPIARRWVSLMLGLGVAVAVGLAPFLGRVGVPGFVSLLSVYPESIQTLAIAISSIVMGIVATSVQFYGASRFKAADLRRWFFRTTVSLLALVFGLLFVHSATIARVSYDGGETASFVIGFADRRPSCEEDCPSSSVSDEECIKRIGLVNSAIASCWGSRAVRMGELTLVIFYVMVTGLFGAIVGLLTLQMNQRR